jgi:citrate synthase
MSDIDFLLQQRGKLLDRSGGWLVDKGVFSHGKDLLRDMLPNKRYFHVLVLNALGYVPEDRFCRWLEAIHICLSWPDPRIWCNGVGALAGSSETTALAATAAGMLASDSRMYGPYSLKKGVQFIQDSKQLIDGGVAVSEYIELQIKNSGGKVHIMGFARPIATGDERVEAMLSLGKELGYSIGPHLQLGLDMEDYLIEHYDESMNVGGYVCAFLADQGLMPEQVYRLFATVVSSGVTACYVEQLEKPNDAYLPQTVDDVEYNGPEKRQLPSA